jgi:hypothetical protein
MVRELWVLLAMAIEVKLLRAIDEDMLDVAQLFNDAAYQLRRLGRGVIQNGSHDIYSWHIYKCGDKTRIVESFPHDVCFETANRLEEYARVLELHIRGPGDRVS